MKIWPIPPSRPSAMSGHQSAMVGQTQACDWIAPAKGAVSGQASAARIRNRLARVVEVWK